MSELIVTWKSDGRTLVAHEKCWSLCSYQLDNCVIADLISPYTIEESECCTWCGHKVGVRTSATWMIEKTVETAARVIEASDVMLEVYASSGALHVFITSVKNGVPSRIAKTLPRRESQDGFGITCHLVGENFNHKGFCTLEDATIVFGAVNNLLSLQSKP